MVALRPPRSPLQQASRTQKTGRLPNSRGAVHCRAINGMEDDALSADVARIRRSPPDCGGGSTAGQVTARLVEEVHNTCAVSALLVSVRQHRTLFQPLIG